MAILAVDTSSPIASLSLDSDGVIFTKTADSPNSHIESIGALFQELLSEARLVPAAITLILVGQGPGSFTGLRIGYSFVSGLATALKVPVIPFSSLAAMIPRLVEDRPCLALVDARREEFFVAGYKGRNQLLIPEQICAATKLPELLAMLDNTDRNGVLVCCESPVDSLDQNPHVSPGIHSEGLLRIDRAGFSPSYSIAEIADLHPNYLRSVAAVKLRDR